jgi:spermidine/putrescine transport system permease protein
LNRPKKIIDYFLPCFVSVLYIFLYLPIIVLILFSFNKNAFTYQWKGFTIEWYYALFESSEVWSALSNSLLVASISVVLSISMGALLVFFSTRIKRLLLLFYGSLAIPEIVLAVGMLSFFALTQIPLGITALIAGHTLLGLGYVIPIIYIRFNELSSELIEASLDLGASQVQTFFRIVLPWLAPALFAASLLVFIISFDDFVISFFCTSAASQTLPIYIFSMIRAGEMPIVSALSTVLLFVSSLFVLLFSALQIKRIGLGR